MVVMEVATEEDMVEVMDLAMEAMVEAILQSAMEEAMEDTLQDMEEDTGDNMNKQLDPLAAIDFFLHLYSPGLGLLTLLSNKIFTRQ